MTEAEKPGIKVDPAHIAQTLVETHIAAKPEAVWRGLIDDIGTWWPQDFYAGGEEGKRRFAFEEKLGGRMYEEWDGGGGILWGTVQSFQPAKQLQVVGHTFPQWGGPTTWYGTFSLEADGEGTRLRFEDASLGRINPEQLEGNRSAWHFLFCQALKAHLEGAPAPKWES